MLQQQKDNINFFAEKMTRHWASKGVEVKADFRKKVFKLSVKGKEKKTFPFAKRGECRMYCREL